MNIQIPGLSGRVKPKVLTTFTRQLATLVDAGLPLLRGLRVLEKQERHPTLKQNHRRTWHRHRRRQHLLRSAGPAPESVQPPFREHGQGGRVGRRARSRARPPRRIHGEGQKIKGKVIAAMFYPSPS